MWLMSNEIGSAFKIVESESNRNYLELMGWIVCDLPEKSKPSIEHVVMAPDVPAEGVKDDSTLYVPEPKPEKSHPARTRKQASK